MPSMHMPKPDVSLPKEKELAGGVKVLAGKIFYQGKMYRYILQNGCSLLRPDMLEPVHKAAGLEDCIAWLTAEGRRGIKPAFFIVL